jgi:hypothetical protein
MEKSKDNTAKWDDFPDQEKNLVGFIFSCESLMPAFSMLEPKAPWFIEQLAECRFAVLISKQDTLSILTVMIMPPDDFSGKRVMYQSVLR